MREADNIILGGKSYSFPFSFFVRTQIVFFEFFHVGSLIVIYHISNALFAAGV